MRFGYVAGARQLASFDAELKLEWLGCEGRTANRPSKIVRKQEHYPISIG